jgi:hypothetical protein
MIHAHQPGSQPIDIPETIPNPVVPQPVRTPAPAKEPVKVPAPAKVVNRPRRYCSLVVDLCESSAQSKRSAADRELKAILQRH